MKRVPVQHFFIGEGEPLCFISGPCVIESESHCLYAAEFLTKLTESYPVNFVFKSSYDKANRSSIDSYRGPGLEKGLEILRRVKTEFNIPILTDVHTPQEALLAGKVCDIIQIPAFLCRQTDLIAAAAQSGAVINIKKGQFVSPWNMGGAVKKATSWGNEKILLTDRGVSFGYNNLVSDMRAIPAMQQLGYPVCFDATHSVQLPGSHGTHTGGQREYIPLLARCAVAAGVNALYIESHQKPSEAQSDAASVIDFKDLPQLLDIVVRLYSAITDESVLR